MTGPKVFLFLFAICLIVYFNTLSNDFLYDDDHLIVNNTYIKNIMTLPNIFLVDFFHFAPLHPVSYYRPIPILTHALEYKIWRLNPYGYHLTNIVLHALNSYLVYLLIFLLFGNFNLALLSGTLFCLHPAHSTTVSLIFNRGDLLLFFFGTVSIISYILFRRLSKFKYYLLSLICFSLSMFTKENAILLLPLLCLCLYCAGLIKEKANLKYLSAFAICYLLYLYLRLILLKIPFPRYDTYQVYNFDFFFAFSNFLKIVMNYLKLLIFPLGLYYHHGIDPITALSGKIFLVFIFLVSMISLFIWGVKNKKGILVFGMAWFALGISYVIKAMHTFGFNQLAMMEHWLYLASIGFFVVIADIFNKLFKRAAKIAIALFVSLLFFWSILTIRYNSFGKGEILFYQYILANSTKDVDAHFNLANTFLELNNYASAEKNFKIALSIDPHAPATPDIYLGLGNVYFKKNDFNEAQKWYKMALEYIPTFAEAWNNLGLAYKKQGKKQEVYDAFQKALSYKPELAVAYINLGDLYFENKDLKRAIVLYQKAYYLNPDNGNCVLRLVKAYLKLNDSEQAENILRGISDKHILAEIYSGLGLEAVGEGDYLKALSNFNRALELNPASRMTLLNLGVLYANKGDLKKAISIWQKANALYPEDEEIKSNIRKAKALLK